jgi:hypothetical protein
MFAFKKMSIALNGSVKSHFCYEEQNIIVEEELLE